MGLQAYYENPGAITTCVRHGTDQEEDNAKKDNPNGAVMTRLLPILGWILPILMIASLGIMADLALKKYLESKQSEGQEATLVPWKSGTNQAEPYKATIPIRATLLTVSTSLTWTLGLCPVFFAMGFNQLVYIGLLAYEVVQVPMIIAWTAKLNRKVKPAPQMNLNQLHFHDEDLENSAKSPENKDDTNARVDEEAAKEQRRKVEIEEALQKREERRRRWRSAALKVQDLEANEVQETVC